LEKVPGGLAVVPGETRNMVMTAGDWLAGSDQAVMPFEQGMFCVHNGPEERLTVLRSDHHDFGDTGHQDGDLVFVCCNKCILVNSLHLGPLLLKVLRLEKRLSTLNLMRDQPSDSRFRRKTARPQIWEAGFSREMACNSGFPTEPTSKDLVPNASAFVSFFSPGSRICATRAHPIPATRISQIGNTTKTNNNKSFTFFCINEIY
jgi:hypothetical protein